jgi:hypothetical protein
MPSTVPGARCRTARKAEPHNAERKDARLGDWALLRPINEWWIAKAARRFLNLVVEGWVPWRYRKTRRIFWNFLLYYYRRGCEGGFNRATSWRQWLGGSFEQPRQTLQGHSPNRKWLVPTTKNGYCQMPPDGNMLFVAARPSRGFGADVANSVRWARVGCLDAIGISPREISAAFWRNSKAMSTERWSRRRYRSSAGGRAEGEPGAAGIEGGVNGGMQQISNRAREL